MSINSVSTCKSEFLTDNGLLAGPSKPTTNDPPELLPATTGALMSPAELLAVLQVQITQKERASSNVEALANEQLEAKQTDARIAEMHDNADRVRTQGLVDGMFIVADGAAKFGQSMYAASGESKANKRGAAYCGLTSSVIGSAKAITDGRMSAELKDSETRQAELDKSAKLYGNLANRGRDFAHNAQSDAAKSIDLLKQIIEAELACKRAVVMPRI